MMAACLRLALPPHVTEMCLRALHILPIKHRHLHQCSSASRPAVAVGAADTVATAPLSSLQRELDQLSGREGAYMVAESALLHALMALRLRLLRQLEGHGHGPDQDQNGHAPPTGERAFHSHARSLLGLCSIVAQECTALAPKKTKK